MRSALCSLIDSLIRIKDLVIIDKMNNLFTNGKRVIDKPYCLN